MKEIKDKELLNSIKDFGEGLEIPKSLEPDNMMKLIEEKKREGHFEESNTVKGINEKSKKKKKMAVIIGGLATAVTAASVALIIAGVGMLNRGNEIDLNNNSMFDSVKTESDKNQAVAVLNGYDKLLNRIVIQETLQVKTGPFDEFMDWFDGLTKDEIYVDDMITNEMMGDVPEFGADSKPTDDETPDYSDTNVRTEGVMEGDIVKTDGKYIYSLNQYRCWSYVDECEELGDVVLTIYEADGENSKKLSTISVKNEIFSVVEGKNRIFNENGEMLIYKDKLIIVTDYCANTIVLVYDVSDRNNPVITDKLFVEGQFDSCRMVDGYLYVFADKRISISEIVDDESFYDIAKDYKNIDATEALAPKTSNGKLLDEDIFVSECEQYDMYHMIATIDMNDTSKFKQVKAVLGQDGQSEIYVNNNNIYYFTDIYYSYVHEAREEDHKECLQSEIISLSYKDGIITPKATGVINGQIGDEFSADEYEGYLRVAVSTTIWNGKYEKQTIQYFNGTEWVTEEVYVKMNMYYSGVNENSALYVLNEDLQVVGSIPNLKEDESVYGVRFDGDIAYVVTYREMDPLFTIDLKDPTNPTVIGALKIPGFSTYLHKWDENTLIGIGYDEYRNIKISTFDISDKTNVLEKDICSLNNVYYSEAVLNHKAVFVSPEKNLLGFMDDSGNYRVFSYVDGELTVVISEEFDDDYYYYQARGMYIGDCIYIVVPGAGVSVYDIDSYELLKEL